ncbi:MAG: hypothetical protein ABFD86_17235 [Bryobacteraceae bacterium]
MAQIVIVHDTRLDGEPPRGDSITIVSVNGHTRLSTLVQRINDISFQYGSEIRLRIMCHGYEVDGHGGYGLQLCQDDLKLTTVRQLRPWSGNLSYGITIYSCAAADVAPGRTGLDGDGRMLCSEIARITATGVRAADATQFYRYSSLSAINFGRWEGNVIEWDARGVRVGMEHEPEQSPLHG